MTPIVTISHPYTAVAGVLLVGLQRRSSGDKDLDARRRGKCGNKFLHRDHRLIRQIFAHVAGEIDLRVCGLAVRTLRSHPRQRIAPEVLNVLDVFGVGFELVDHAVVEAVGILAEGLFALQDDHRRVVGIELCEDLADALHGDHRRRVFGGHRHRLHLTNGLKLRHRDTEHHDETNPATDDRDRQPTDPPGYAGPADLVTGRNGGSMAGALTTSAKLLPDEN